MTQKRPRKCWGDNYRRVEDGYDTIYYRRWYYELPDMTDEEKEIVSMSSMAIEKNSIVDMLSRYLAVHKRMQVDGEKRQILFADYANMLYGLPEYAVMLGINDMISKDKSIWFPPCAKLIEVCESYVIKQPEKMEGEERV